MIKLISVSSIIGLYLRIPIRKQFRSILSRRNILLSSSNSSLAESVCDTVQDKS